MTTASEERRRHTYARLAKHDDPLLREIGVQLSNGVLRPSDLLTDPSYRNVLARSLRRIRAAIAEPTIGAQPSRDGAGPPGSPGRPVRPVAGPPPPWEDGGLSHDPVPARIGSSEWSPR